ncbi:MAG: methylenetetrahydrofolate reductase [NAD(P)H] [Acidobacteria bacterium]|nr:MAG: methylenetetrahydrofolate reductase [NAD(P)H] [Acidobacteriota bacterium]
MKVTEHLERATEPLISFEIIPPLRGGDIKSLMALIDDLVLHHPPFIDITSHAAEVIYEETPEGIQKRIKRKRPGTLGVCALIQNKYNIDAVPHVLCHGFNRQETEDFLIELRYLGIDNVLAIRGDDPGFKKPLAPGKSVNNYALDLIAQIAAMNRGEYLEALLDAQPSDFCIGTSGYPEKHFEAPNLLFDIRRAKEKIEAGASYIVTQMFFNNEHFFNYVDACRAEGIEVPIIPGLKVLTSKRQLHSIPRTFHCEIPPALSEEVERAKNAAEVREIGVEWARQQAQELLDRGVPSLHFYVMQSSRAINQLLKRLKR